MYTEKGLSSRKKEETPERMREDPRKTTVVQTWGAAVQNGAIPGLWGKGHWIQRGR